MLGVRRVVPANSKLSPTKPGAVPLVQFKLLLKLLSAAPPLQTSLPATMASEMLALPVIEAVSVRVATSNTFPTGVPAPTVTVLVQMLLPALTSATLDGPPIGVAFTVTLFTVPAVPLAAVTVISTFWLRRAGEGVAEPTPVGPATAE